MSDQTTRGRSGSFKGNRKGQRSVKGGGGGAVGVTRGIFGPDERKFESEVLEITTKIRELENKLKPVASTTTQMIHAEMAKENAVLADLDKEKEENAAKTKAIETKIREVGVEYKEKKTVASDHLAGVRYKTEGRHDDAVQRLEQQILIRRCSSSEERKFKQEIEAVRKSRERLSEYSVVKGEVDLLKNEQESLRGQRDTLFRQAKEIREKELAGKDRVANLRLEMEEAKERKKVTIKEREEIRKKIDELQKQRIQLHDRFRSEQLAFKQQLVQQSEEERLRRNEHRAAREAKRKYRVIEQSFHQKQQYTDRMDVCRVLISHLQKLNINSTTAATPHTLPASGTLLEEDPSPTGSATNLDPPSPMPVRSESAPTVTSAPQEGEYILRREEEVLVPTRVNLTRKRSRKEKKRVPITKRLNLNHTMFRQFASLEVAPPNTFSDIPQALSNLQDKLVYYERMSKADPEDQTSLDIPVIPMLPADSGLGSTAPSEIVELTNSQEELEPLLKLKNGDISPPVKTAIVGAPLRSATADASVTTTGKGNDLSSKSEGSLISETSLSPPALVTMASASTATTGSGVSIAVENGDE